MTDKVINRAKTLIDRSDFNSLSKLNMKHEWLQSEPDGLFELWCLSDNDEQKSLIKFLIDNFSFIDDNKLAESCKTISDQIVDSWNLSPENTYIIATCDDDEPDGSQSIIQSLKNKFPLDWRAKNFFNFLPKGLLEIPDNSNIVLIDDFIGTGDTIIDKLDFVALTLNERGVENISIRFVSLASMEFSRLVLDSLDVEYFSVFWLQKGITELKDNGVRESAIQSMKILEDKLHKSHRENRIPNFGYKESEALFSLGYNNIPDNVFPIFWWPIYKGGEVRKTLFKRV